MATPSYDLIDIVQVLQRNRKLILLVSLLSTVSAGIFYAISTRRYEAKTEFFVSNPLYSDRNNLFRNMESRFVDYFTTEDDMDKVIAIANSQKVRDMVIRLQGLDKAYQVDYNDPKQREWLVESVFKKNLRVKRTEYQHMELSFSDKDPNMASKVANGTVAAIEQVYREYFNAIRSNVYHAIAEKASETDSVVLHLTDTLARLRDRYQIYDIISPARQNVMTSTLRSNGAVGFGRGVEEIQNIEAIKDQLVKDRANYASLMNEFSTGIKGKTMPLITVVTAAEPPVHTAGLSFALTLVAGFLIGLVFSAFLSLLIGYSKKVHEAVLQNN